MSRLPNVAFASVVPLKPGVVGGVASTFPAYAAKAATPTNSVQISFRLISPLSRYELARREQSRSVPRCPAGRGRRVAGPPRRSAPSRAPPTRDAAPPRRARPRPRREPRTRSGNEAPCPRFLAATLETRPHNEARSGPEDGERLAAKGLPRRSGCVGDQRRGDR